MSTDERGMLGNGGDRAISCEEAFARVHTGRDWPAGVSAPRTGPPAQSDFLAGRDDELAVLRHLLTELAAGVGGAVLVEGEQGIGKSALLRRVLGDAAVKGIRVAWATSDELHQGIPLRLIRECLGGVRPARPAAAGDPGDAGDPGAAGER